MEDNQSKDLILLKIFILGGGGGDGKTCIFRRYVENTFSEISPATIGLDFKIKYIKYGKYNLKLQIWDTAGQERYRKSFYPYCYKSADGCIFVFDITNHGSFNEIIKVINELNEKFDFEKPKIICANKCDLEKGREITKEEIEKELENYRYNIEVFKTSAKTGQNIDEAFNRLVELIMNKRGENELEKKREENKLIKKKREEKDPDSEILENINNEKYLYDFRIDIINSDNITFSLLNMIKIFCNDIGNLIGRKILEFNNYKIRLIIYIKDKNKKGQEKFLNKIKSKEDGALFFIDINSNSSFEEIKNLISENIQNNSEKLIVIKKNSNNENKELSKEIENYALSQKIKIFIIDDIYKEIVNNIFFKLISLILKKKGNNQIYKDFNKEFNKYICENKKYNYALIGDKYSGKTKIFKEYLNSSFPFYSFKSNIKKLNINNYKIELEIYDIDESNIIELLNKYEINGIIFIFSSNSLESFEKMKEYINIIKQKYKNDYESIIYENKSNFIEIISEEIEDISNTIFIQLTYKILLKEKNEELISEFYEYYKKYLPIHEYEKKLNKYLNF